MGKLTALTEGCYTVEIRDRESGRARCKFAEGAGFFERKRDATSDAEFSTKIDLDCAKCFCIPRPRKDELAIIRDDWPEPAWVGPITRIVDDPDTRAFKINAEDRTFWWDGAAASSNFERLENNQIDTVEVVSEIIRQFNVFAGEELLDHNFRGSKNGKPPASGLLLTADIERFESLWAEFAGLAESVFDFTVVGPHLYWGAPGIPISDGPRLNSTHWTNRPLIDRDASSVVSQVRVTGQGGVSAAWPPTSIDNGYGHKTGYLNDSNLNTAAEALAVAVEVYEANKEPTDFIVTGGGSLSSSFPLSMHELIPGRRFLVDLSGACLEASAELELFNLIVEFNSVASPVQKLQETRVAADFSQPGAIGSAERQSAAG